MGWMPIEYDGTGTLFYKDKSEVRGRLKAAGKLRQNHMVTRAFRRDRQPVPTLIDLVLEGTFQPAEGDLQWGGDKLELWGVAEVEFELQGEKRRITVIVVPPRDPRLLWFERDDTKMKR